MKTASLRLQVSSLVLLFAASSFGRSLLATPPKIAGAEEIRLDLDPASLGAVPAADQGQTNLGYAFAAAQLIDAWRSAHAEEPIEQLTSPLILAADTTLTSARLPDQRGRDTLASGYVEDALGQARVDGIFRVDRPFVDMRDDLEPVARSLSANSGRRALLPLPEARWISRDDLNSNGLLAKIEQIIAQRTPVAVTYCADGATGVIQATGLDDGRCSRQSAVIVGRRQINGRVELLVRDSLCGEYRRSDGSKICEDHQYWANASAIAKNTYKIVWL